MTPENFKDRLSVVRLWVHESERVLGDRLVSDADVAKFNDFRVSTTRKYFDGIPQVHICKWMTGHCRALLNFEVASFGRHAGRTDLWRVGCTALPASL
jgi:hypothetical protein